MWIDSVTLSDWFRMVLVLKTLVELWRERLAYLERRCASGGLESRTLEIERRVLAFLLKRHADASYAEPPQQAEPLDGPSAEDSARLRLSTETLERLGLDPRNSGIANLREIRSRRPRLAGRAMAKRPLPEHETWTWPQTYLDHPVFQFKNYPAPPAPEAPPVEAPAPEKTPFPAEWLSLPWCLVILLAMLLALVLLGRL